MQVLQFEAINSDTDSSWDLVLEHRSGRGGDRKPVKFS